MAGLRFMNSEQMGSFEQTEQFDFALDFNRYLLRHPSSSFVMRMSGQRHQDLGINDGDLLIVDRSITPKASSLIVVNGDTELLLMRFSDCKAGLQEELWGVVVHLIRSYE